MYRSVIAPIAAFFVLTLCAACEKNKGTNDAPGANQDNQARGARQDGGGLGAESPALANSAAASDAQAPTASGSAAASAASALGRKAEADFAPEKKSKLSGKALLVEQPSGGVRITVSVQDAPPGAKGIHIHEKGDCSNLAAHSMGKHFAPTSQSHGLPTDAEHHLGDLGNITVGKDGKGRLEMTVAGANLRPGDPHSFLGKALIIHTDTDKGPGDPAGKSGAPMACAVIQETTGTK